MTLLAAAAVCTAGILAALLPALRRHVGAYRATSRVAMANQHHAPELVGRQPGKTLYAAYDEPPRIAYVAADPGDPEPDVWLTTYPPGSLGDYPETLPEVPGRLGGEPRDVEDLLTGAIRHLRDMAR